MNLGKVLSRVVCGGRTLFGLRNTEVVVERNGIFWSLDLNEAIDLMIYIFGYFEKTTVQLMRSLLKEGQTYIDVGSNIGAHVLTAAQVVGPKGVVVACEPTNWAYSKLIQNIKLNKGLSKIVRAQCVFVSDSSSIPDHICSSWDLSAKPDNFQHMGSAKSTSSAQSVSLDDLIVNNNPDHLGLIKIDVDGFELEVLRSGEKSIKKYKPDIVIEYAPYCLAEKGVSEKEFFVFMSQLGYKFVYLDNLKRIDFNEAALNHYTPDMGGINILFSDKKY